MAHVRVYMKQGCPYSAGAKRLLDEKGIEYEQIDVVAEPSRRAEMERLSGGETTVPQIFFDDRHVGGYTELQELFASSRVPGSLSGGSGSAQQ